MTADAVREVEEFLDVWDAAPAHRTGYRDVISSQKSGDPDDGRKLRAGALRELVAEVRDLRSRIANARAEIARQDTAAQLAPHDAAIVGDALAAVETRLVGPEHRPATPDGAPAWPLERAFAPDGSLRMVRPAISETGDGTEP